MLCKKEEEEKTGLLHLHRKQALRQSLYIKLPQLNPLLDEITP